MDTIGKKCECDCHENKCMHFVPCCFKCPCCKERISFENYGMQQRFIMDHLICCVSNSKDSDNLEKYAKSLGLGDYLKKDKNGVSSFPAVGELLKEVKKRRFES